MSISSGSEGISGIGRSPGFAYRGTIGTLIGLIQGRRTIGEAMRNWLAVLSLPFVFAGLARDFWQPFEDYAAADATARVDVLPRALQETSRGCPRWHHESRARRAVRRR